MPENRAELKKYPRKRRRVSGAGHGLWVVVLLFTIIGILAILNAVNYIDPSFFNLPSPQEGGPQIYGVAPMQGQILTTESVVISASYSDAGANITSVTLLLDNTNVTGSAAVGPSQVSYAGKLAEGSHTASLVVNDSNGHLASETWTFQVNLTLESAVLQVLNDINTARMAAGVPNATLVEPIASTYRTQDMLANQYFGHYDLSGIYPGYYYTKLGGLYTMEENIGYNYYSLPVTAADVASAVNGSLYAMIYNDGFHLYEHRDSLLDPTNNYVDISVANDSNRVYIVIHMIKDWVSWESPPSFTNGTFSCAGILDLNNSTITDVLIYYSNSSMYTSYTYDSSLHVLTGASTYTIGDPIVGVLPPPQLYEFVDTMRPTTWSVNGQQFSISFKLTNITNPGIYTFSLWAENTLTVRDPYDPTRYNDTLPVLEYAISLP